MNTISIEDLNYLSEQSPEQINIVLAGMTSLLHSTDEKVTNLENQQWYIRMLKTITGKNKLTLEEIKQNHNKFNLYMAEAITELYNRNCINQKILQSLAIQLNEIYAEHIQLKQILGSFVKKLNDKIDSIDNFHMLNTEIEQGVYSNKNIVISLCQILSQFDNRILNDQRKQDIIRRSLVIQGVFNDNPIPIADYLNQVINIPNENIGEIYLELSTIRENFIANVFIGMIEKYHYLSTIEQRTKNKYLLIKDVLQSEKVDNTASLSSLEIFDIFLKSKIDAKSKLSPLDPIQELSDEEITKQGMAAVDSKDYEEAIRLFSIAAERGYADAQNHLGVRYDHGEGVEENSKIATEWFLKAATQGHAKAQCNLALHYFEGNGITENKKDALYWFHRSANQGYDRAQYFLGSCYFYGDGVYEDESQGVYWFRQAAAHGNMNAQYLLGIAYLYGNGVDKNDSEAVNWLQKSAEQGHDIAQYVLGTCYAQGCGVEKNLAQSVFWYKKSCDQGNPNALLRLGTAYMYGYGVVKNLQTAKKLLNDAIKAGDENGWIDDEDNARAHFLLAETYYAQNIKDHLSLNALDIANHIPFVNLGSFILTSAINIDEPKKLRKFLKTYEGDQMFYHYLASNNLGFKPAIDKMKKLKKYI